MVDSADIKFKYRHEFLRMNMSFYHEIRSIEMKTLKHMLNLFNTMKKLILLSIVLSSLPCIITNEDVLASESNNVTITSRIIGGVDVDIKYFPYQVSLRVGGIYACTATSITDHNILVAAHCITHNELVKYPYDTVLIHSGTSSSIELGNTYQIFLIHVHPGWTGTDESCKNHDLAHIQVRGIMKPGAYQRAVDAPDKDVVSYIPGFVTGWGAFDLNNPNTASPTLKLIQMLSLSYIDCQPFLRIVDQINKEQLCVFQTPGYGCCQGDSGAAFVIDNKLVGIHSWTYSGQTASGVPEVFVNIYAEQDFIDSVLDEINN